MQNNEILQSKDGCGEIISSKTLPLSSGVTITPLGIDAPLVAKMPVVLAEREIQINIEAEFKLQEPYYEIKRIKKNIYLNQCELLATSGLIVDGNLISGKLFISGYVRKNIEYATADCVVDKFASGRVTHTTTDIPFKAVTEVQYSTPPVVSLRGPQLEVDLLNSSTCHDCTGTLVGKSGCEQSFEDSINFTEKPYCEFEGVRIVELDLNRDPMCSLNNTDVQFYNKIIEKMVIYVRVKVLQLQQVFIPEDCDDQ